MPRTYTLWAIFDSNGDMLLWSIRAQRFQAQRSAAAGCMGFTQYALFDGDRARWKYLYKRGYRCRKVKVIP